jgi:hypothetical protein
MCSGYKVGSRRKDNHPEVGNHVGFSIPHLLLWVQIQYLLDVLEVVFRILEPHSSLPTLSGSGDLKHLLPCCLLHICE